MKAIVEVVVDGFSQARAKKELIELRHSNQASQSSQCQ
jgi:hypothetical protein